MATTVAKEKVKQEADFKSEIDRIFELQKQHRWEIAKTTAKERIAKLKKLLALVEKRKPDIYKAMYADYKKPQAEVDLSEIYPVSLEAKHAIRHLKKWMKPYKVKPTMAMMTARAHLRYEPKGQVLIISPWNYPINLTFGPLVAAVAAGNCCIIKPSEMTPHTSALMKEMVAEIFPEHEVALIEGDKVIAQALLEKPFNHIFFTGSPAVGKIIMAAAAKHLTSVTLELGGKSPIIVDETADLKDAASKIMWTKFANNGQTCIAPDYLFVHETKYAPFLEACKKAIHTFYGETDEAHKETPHYARLVNSRHHRRLCDLLNDAIEKGANVELGGKSDETENYLSPTLLTNVNDDMTAMQEEIFGPVLPIKSYSNLDTVLQEINGREKPLALYIFSKNRKNINKVVSKTTSGGMCINDVAVHYFHSNLPFGGVNNSGFGSTHGFYGFKAFSHERSVMKHVKHSPLKLMLPPYTPRVQKIIDLVVKYF